MRDISWLISDRYFTIAIWVMVFFVLVLQVIPQTESLLESFLFVTAFTGLIFLPVHYLSDKLLLTTIKTRKTKKFLIVFFLSSLYGAIVFSGCLYLFDYLEKEGIFPRSSYFDMDDIPLYALSILFSSCIFINITMCGLRFLLEYIKSQKIIHEYQLRTLQHQFTPHFMFNVLNHIHVLMETNQETASSLLIKYSEILRYQLYNGERKLVTLNDEIQFLKDFIAVEEFRWEDKLKVTCNWEIENEDIEIPSLLFITLIENAFKHVSRSNLEKGFVNLDFRQQDRTISLDILNSKSLIEKKKIGTGLGLKNIKQRLDILYYNNHELIIEDTELTFRAKLILNV